MEVIVNEMVVDAPCRGPEVAGDVEPVRALRSGPGCAYVKMDVARCGMVHDAANQGTPC